MMGGDQNGANGENGKSEDTSPAEDLREIAENLRDGTVTQEDIDRVQEIADELRDAPGDSSGNDVDPMNH